MKFILLQIVLTAASLAYVDAAVATTEADCLETGISISVGYGTTYDNCSNFLKNQISARKSNHPPRKVAWFKDIARTSLSIAKAQDLKIQLDAEKLANNGSTKKKRKRKRRSTTTLGTCSSKNSARADGKLRICSECEATTDFGVDSDPRYVGEVICDTTDEDCFGDEGTCVESTFTVKIKNTVTLVETEEDIRTECNCVLHPSSVLTHINV